MNDSVQREIEELTNRLLELQHAYYVEHVSLVSDIEYDRLFDRLLLLEQQHPELKSPHSPTSRVGSDLVHELPEVEHAIPVLSLDKAYSAQAVLAWMEKCRKKTADELSFTAEEKNDGVAIVLYYRNGILERGVTRGNGYVGNDVTPNVKTIAQVPLKLKEPVDASVRGEIFLNISDFHRISSSQETEFANPRNLAAGSIRRVKSRETAKVPLQLCVYEGYVTGRQEQTHVGMLQYLSHLGFPLSRHIGVFYPRGHAGHDHHEGFSHWHIGGFDRIEQYIAAAAETRSDRDYEIDGLVFKVNELNARDELGYTGHHPRWASAYKFESPEAQTVIERIEIQVGRTGRITPVARVRPVKIGGSVVSNVTLHNQEYIRMLEAAEGDAVSVSKRGDVIPAVERVVEKNPQALPYWEIPEHCPSCEEELALKGAHHFCRNTQCPDQVFGRIQFFCSRKQMDIDGFGPETIRTLIELGAVHDIPDIYEADLASVLAGVPGFKEKKITLLQKGLKKSMTRPFDTVLASLGIPDIGIKAAQLLIAGGYQSIESMVQAAQAGEESAFTDIKGIGPAMAASLGEALRDPEMVRRIQRLQHAGLCFYGTADEPEGEQGFADQTWCVTGSFDSYKPRSKAEELIRRHGGKVVSAVSGSVTHLLAGQSAGSKLAKAKELNITIVTEDEFTAMISSMN